jgi:hypothetical protein
MLDTTVTVTAEIALLIVVALLLSLLMLGVAALAVLGICAGMVKFCEMITPVGFVSLCYGISFCCIFATLLSLIFDIKDDV